MLFVIVNYFSGKQVFSHQKLETVIKVAYQLKRKTEEARGPCALNIAFLKLVSAIF